MSTSPYCYDFPHIESSVQGLIDNGLADSADKMCNIILSLPMGLPPSDRSQMLELHGDSAFASKSYRRALQLYRQASQPLSSAPCAGQSVTPTVTTTCPVSITTTRLAQLRLKECQCHLQLEDVTIALRELEAVPVDLRDVKTNVCLGRLYKNAGLRRHAITTVCTPLDLTSHFPFILCILHSFLFTPSYLQITLARN
jgi:hypothetical protein